MSVEDNIAYIHINTKLSRIIPHGIQSYHDHHQLYIFSQAPEDPVHPKASLQHIKSHFMGPALMAKSCPGIYGNIWLIKEKMCIYVSVI